MQWIHKLVLSYHGRSSLRPVSKPAFCALETVRLTEYSRLAMLKIKVQLSKLRIVA